MNAVTLHDLCWLGAVWGAGHALPPLPTLIQGLQVAVQQAVLEQGGISGAFDAVCKYHKGNAEDQNRLLDLSSAVADH